VWFSRKTKPEITDTVWFAKPEKYIAIAYAAREAVASGRLVLVLAHFQTTLAEVGRVFDTNRLEQRIQSHPFKPGPGGIMRKRTDAGLVILSLSERIAPYHAPPEQECPADTLSIIVSEHYPIRDRDDSILAFAAACGLREPVAFHSSLEDSLFREFGSERYAEVLKALSRGSTEPMSGKPVTRAIRSAQDKVKKKAFGDQYVSSPEEWFTYNLHKGLTGKPMI
jgi:hypothetical protein